jgi:putative ABC exporter
MLGASLFIIICSARNRLRLRLRRLREPRYLLGAIAAVVYLYVTVFARMRGVRAGSARRRQGSAPTSIAVWSMLRASAPAAVGLALLVTTAASWVLPMDSGLLEFSDAETAFLFPAPVSRRQLLLHRMLRSQLGMLFGSVIIAVLTPSSSGYTRLRLAIAMWLLFCIGKVYFTGVTLARARLRSPGASARRIARLPIGVLAGVIAIAASSLVRELSGVPIGGLQDLAERIGRATSTGLARVVLWPFLATARPVFAEWPGPYLQSIASAVVVLGGTIVWVLASDEAFQDAAADAAGKRAGEAAARAATVRARATGITLALTGRPELAFAWKGALQTLRVVDRRSLARLLALVLLVSVMSVSFGRARGLAVTLGLFSTIGAAFAILMAPQVLSLDLRQDLRHLELLKTWPVQASAIVRGEIIWPGALVTAAAWGCLGLALLLSARVFTTAGPGLRVAAAAAGAILAPALVFAQFVIHNAVALMFPAWVPLGNQRPRGLDAMGQRLILLGATWLTLIVMALPGAAAGGVVWVAFRRLVGDAALVPAALVCAGIMGIEVVLATEALGPVYERLDVMAVERAE